MKVIARYIYRNDHVMAALAKVLLINSKNVFCDRRSIDTFVSFACMPFCFLIDSMVIEKIIGNLNYYNFSQVRRSMTKTGSIHFGFFSSLAP